MEKKWHLYAFVLLIAFFSSANHAKPRSSSYPYISGDTFRALAHHRIDEDNKAFNPAHVKNGDIIFIRAYDSYMNIFIKALPKINARFILITHNSIKTMPGKHAYLLDDKRLIAWFAQNKGAINHSKLIAIPVGIANSYNKHGNISTLTQVIKQPQNNQKKHLLYVNFSKTTNGERSAIYKLFTHQSFIFKANKKPWDQYLIDLSKSLFVLSPPGAGIDCHRHWEALLMGGIPIIKSSSINELFTNLPVLIIKDWKLVTPKFLEEQYKKITSKNYNLEMLYADYWINLIESYRAQI